MKPVLNIAIAAMLAVAWLLVGTVPSRAGTEIVVYERYQSYQRYQRITVVKRQHLSRHQVYRHHSPRPQVHRLHRPGYVYHRGRWLSAASMRAGVILDVPIARHHVVRQQYGINPRHHSWCADRYRSYQWRSNTFQPHHGPRRTCYSPYF